MKKFLFAAAGLALVNIATAQSTIEGDATLNNLSLEKAVVTEPGEDSPKKPLEVGGVEISGYVDGYWQTKLNKPNTVVKDRAFYKGAEEFALGNVAVTFSKEIGKAGFVGQVGFGPRTEQANFNNTSSNIQQLYAYYNLTEQVKVTGGRFGTFIGYEVVDAPANFHYSTSNLFQHGPFFHTGVKVDVDLGGGLTAMAGVFNPTDYEAIGPDENYFFGGQLGYGMDNSAIYLSGLHGKVASSTNTSTTQLDLVASTSIEEISLALNASYKMQSSDTAADDDISWYGVAGYAQYAISDTFGAGVRAEYFSNEDGLIPIADADADNVLSFTASLPYSKDGFTFIPEVRFDVSDNDVYTSSSAAPQSTQVTIGAAVNYAF